MPAGLICENKKVIQQSSARQPSAVIEVDLG